MVIYSHREGETLKGKEGNETMKDYMEKLDILAYMVENGYHLGNRTMDDFCRDFSVEDLWNFCQNFFGDDE